VFTQPLYPFSPKRG